MLQRMELERCVSEAKIEHESQPVPNHYHIRCALNHNNSKIRIKMMSVHWYNDKCLASEIEVTELRLSDVLMNFESQYRQRIQSPTSGFSIRIDDKHPQRKHPQRKRMHDGATLVTIHERDCVDHVGIIL
nr:hypothetical protein [Tanacetum cinerariifolium]